MRTEVDLTSDSSNKNNGNEARVLMLQILHLALGQSSQPSKGMFVVAIIKVEKLRAKCQCHTGFPHFLSGQNHIFSSMSVRQVAHLIKQQGLETPLLRFDELSELWQGRHAEHRVKAQKADRLMACRIFLQSHPGKTAGV